MRGRFIVIEGLDGAGSSTQVEQINAFLKSVGFESITTKEPSDGPFGKILRDAVEGRRVFTPELLALGFATDRLEHMCDGSDLQEAIDKGTWVVSDRYVLSALAYQATQGVDMDWLIEINKHVPTPDATIFVDTPVRTCLKRIQKRNSNTDDLFHRFGILSATKKNYMEAIKHQEFVGKLITTDGSKSVDEIKDQAIKGLVNTFRSDFGLFAELIRDL